MKLAMVGLGRMGGNMTRRLLRTGHEVVGYAQSEDSIAELVSEGATGAGSLEEVPALLEAPRVVWVMVPSGPATESVVEILGEALEEGDVVVDGGNSRWTDSVRRSAVLAERGISFLDCGTSGGVWGLEEGYCLMVGGRAEAVEVVRPALEALAPPDGWAHVGPPGAGHFTKMVHNGIEYGMLQAYAEGFELLTSAPELELDPAQIASLWRRGSVVRSWLLDLLAVALQGDPALESVRGWVEDSGEGRWTVHEAVERGVPANAIAHSLFARFTSRQDDSYAMRVIAALRREFGGHAVREAAEPDV